jgi:hypothetical protein
LVEVLIGSILLIGGGGALAIGMHYATVHADYLNQYQVAMNAAQGLLEHLVATDFDTLASAPEFNAARTTGQRCWLEDLNCNGLPDAGEDVNGNNQLDSGVLGNGALSIRIRQTPEDQVRNPDNPSLLDLHVAACWRSKGRPISEDQNCNGQLDAGEDGSMSNPTPNGWIDSPVMVSTRVGRDS